MTSRESQSRIEREQAWWVVAGPDLVPFRQGLRGNVKVLRHHRANRCSTFEVRSTCPLKPILVQSLLPGQTLSPILVGLRQRCEEDRSARRAEIKRVCSEVSVSQLAQKCIASGRELTLISRIETVDLACRQFAVVDGA